MLALLAARAGPALAWHMTDDQGHTVSGPGRVQRVVTLSPALAELVFAAGAGRRLVGTVAYSDYPPDARRVPRVGNAFSVNMEALLALHPGLVLAWGGGTPPAQVRRMRSLGLQVAVLQSERLKDVARHLRLIGRLAGTAGVAARAAHAYSHRLHKLHRKYAHRAPVPVFYQVSLQPLYTVGGPQIITRVLRLCGARNVFAGLPEPAPRVSLEAVLAADPQAIVYPDSFPASRERGFWARLPRIAAVRRHALLSVPADAIARPAPRLLKAARVLCRKIAAVRSSGQKTNRDRAGGAAN